MRCGIDPVSRPSALKTGAQQLLDVLAGHGVELVFGLPGVHNLAIWEALDSSGIRMMGVRHEQAAVYAADGYARATGNLGVAFVTTGPGAANTLAATGEAMASGSPVLVVATDIPTSFRRPGVYRGVLHETRDQQMMFTPVVKDGWTVPDIDSLAWYADRAVCRARAAPPGPAYLGVPTDLLTARPVRIWSPARQGEPPAPVPADSAFEDARRRIEAASRPLIWVGGGARSAGAGPEIAELARRLPAPILTTYGARDVVSSEDPYAVHGSVHLPVVGRLWDEADLVIAIGTDFDGMMTQNWAMPAPRCLVAVNIAEQEASKNYPADVALVGDAKAVVARLLELIPERPDADEVCRTVRAVNEAVRQAVRADEPQAELLLDALEHAAPADAIFVADMCIAGYWVGAFHRLRAAQKLAYPVGWGTLGFGFPAALGAAASADRVICICGDGGFLFACGELATAAQEQLPVTVVIVDDGGYGMLRYDQQTAGHRLRGVDLHTPDFVALARSFGVDAARVDGFGADFAAALADFVARPGPNVLLVRASLRPPPNTSPRWYRSPRHSR